MSNLKYRVALILALVFVSVFALFPRDVKVRQRRADGTFYDTTTRRVPLRKGLDLQGGMHLALDVDESKGAVADKGEAIDRALKVVRTRIEGMGVSETVIQKAGNDRIIVDIPGIDDRERAIKIAQDQAFLQFQITDKTNGLEKALPKLDAIAKAKGIGTAAGATTAAAAPNQGLNGLLTAGTDSAKVAAGAKKDSTKTDSASIPGVTPTRSGSGSVCSIRRRISRNGSRCGRRWTFGGRSTIASWIPTRSSPGLGWKRSATHGS